MHPLNLSTTDNSFTRDLAKGLESNGVDVSPFTWTRAVLGRYDVLHVHWPESVLRHPRRSVQLAKVFAFTTLKHVLLMRRVGLVATIHNIAPHEALDRIASRAANTWYRSATERIYMTREAARRAPYGAGVYIPHQTYFVNRPGPQKRTNSILIAGFLRKYKGIERVIALAVDESRLSLDIVGSPVPVEYGADLGRLIGNAPNVRLDQRALEQEELETVVGLALAVLIPYPDFYSSGIAILALSLGTPIILANSPAARELEEEFGASWVFLLPEDWTTKDLLRAKIWANSGVRPIHADLSNRSVERIGRLHREVYERSLERRRRSWRPRA